MSTPIEHPEPKVNLRDQFDPASAKLAFDPTPELAAKVERYIKVRHLPDNAAILLHESLRQEETADICRSVIETLTKVRDEAKAQAACAMRREVFSRWCKAMQHLQLADEQCQRDTGARFIPKSEWHSIHWAFMEPDTVIGLWLHDSTRETEAAILRKYAPVIRTRPRRIYADRSMEEWEDDYTPVYEKGIEVNEGRAE